MSSRIPPLLEPYIALPPESSLTILTGVIGATTNWLLLRHVYSALRGEGSEDTGVVLVSFMRDGAFWREGAAKLGLDLEGLSRAGKVVLVDGLISLFLSPDAQRPTTATVTPHNERVLGSSRLADVQRDVEAAIADLRTGKKVLVFDAPDTLLAATDEQGATSMAMQNLILYLRSLVHNAIITLSADSPLITSAATTLERDHSGLVLSLAHAADVVQSLRLLDTGTARDVCGVLRLTGPLMVEGEREFLYYVAADGGVRVFGR